MTERASRSETDALDFLVNTTPPDVPLARDGTARWIIERCGTWPFYLQVLGYAVVQAVRDSLGRWLEDKPFYDWLLRIADEALGRS